MSRLGVDADEQRQAPSMEPQPFCCLPWCGKAPSGADKVRIVDGKRLTYPERMVAHHWVGRPGPVMMICQECSEAHHDGRHLFDAKYEDGEMWADEGNGWQKCVMAAEWDH